MNSASKIYDPLYRWFEANKRVLPWRETSDPYKIWVSEIILQQTRVQQGLEYYMRFVERFPDVATMARATEDEVLRLWQGLGYYTRARNMYKGAQMIAERWGGVFPTTFDDIRAIPGVGEYTAGAIASFAYDLPYPALDGNVYRVLARLNDCDVVFDTTAGKKHFHSLAQRMLDEVHPRLFNSAIMELGALQCVPREPDCTACPLRHYCLAYAHHMVEVLPVRKPRPVVQDRELNYAIYLCPQTNEQGQKVVYTLLRQRTEKDIWHHLWEFPQQETSAPSAQRELTFTHLLSHRRLHATFRVYPVTSLPAIPDTIAVAWTALDDYALSRLTLRALQALQ
ncbi:MAG: A/G-specific adenine glycosylase [Paludibacteraceae bacterium]|nr:A/G-specific adenine glycosylase [Paludibacteraceae bacterium]